MSSAADSVSLFMWGCVCMKEGEVERDGDGGGGGIAACEGLQLKFPNLHYC